MAISSDVKPKGLGGRTGKARVNPRLSKSFKDDLNSDFSGVDSPSMYDKNL
jgi:hypothetical protein